MNVLPFTCLACSEERIRHLFGESNWGKAALCCRSRRSGCRPGQEPIATLWLGERTREGKEYAGGKASARWQQRHVCATCPGEYEPVSLLLFSQCGMTLAPSLPGWLAGCRPVHLSVRLSVSLTPSQLDSHSPYLSACLLAH